MFVVWNCYFSYCLTKELYTWIKPYDNATTFRVLNKIYILFNVVIKQQYNLSHCACLQQLENSFNQDINGQDFLR